VLLLWGELEALGLKGLELVIHPDVDGHEEGFCVKIVEGVLTILPHGTPSFFTSQGLGSSSTRRHFTPDRPATCRFTPIMCILGNGYDLWFSSCPSERAGG
jgi:hypothetical protein